jgi:lipoyl(octanoyl) transferase
MGNAGDPGRVGRLPAPGNDELAGRDGVVSPDLIGGSVGPAGATLRTGPTPDASARPPLVFVRAGQVPYELAWSEQRRLHAARLAGEVPDAVLLLEHPSVYTAGRRTEAWERPIDGTPVIDVDRGGKITWHGPGQLVGYPIVALPDPVDVVAYVRRLEAVLIEACAVLGLRTSRIKGRSGVWVPADDRGPDRKVAAIGIRVSRRVAMHGFALNCNPDLAAFDRIVACGITDAGVTSLTAELGRQVTVADAIDVVEAALRAGLAAPPVEAASPLAVAR